MSDVFLPNTNPKLSGNLTFDTIPKIDGFWYLASPYSNYEGGLHDAFYDVCMVSGWLVNRGIPHFCPIAQSHSVGTIRHIDLRDHEIWMPVDIPLLHAAHGVLIAPMDGWDTSVGVAQECRTALELGKPVYRLMI